MKTLMSNLLLHIVQKERPVHTCDVRCDFSSDFLLLTDVNE